MAFHKRTHSEPESEQSDWETVSSTSRSDCGEQEAQSSEEAPNNIASSNELFQNGNDNGEDMSYQASEICRHLVKAVSDGETEELAKGFHFYYFADIIGVAAVLQGCGMADELGVKIGDHVDAKKLNEAIVIAVESKLREMGHDEETAARARIAKRREELGEVEMRKQYAAMLSAPRGEEVTTESDQTQNQDHGTASTKMKGLGLPLSMTANLAALILSGIPAEANEEGIQTQMKGKCKVNSEGQNAKDSQTATVKGHEVPASMTDDLANLILSTIPAMPSLASTAEPPKKSKAKWDRLREARARCEESLRPTLPFDDDPKFLDNLSYYKKWVLDIKNSSPEIYDTMRVACCAGSINKVTNKMRKEKEAGTYVEPGPGREALDDPICRRWRTLKRDWPDLEVIIKTLYEEHMEAKEKQSKNEEAKTEESKNEEAKDEEK